MHKLYHGQTLQEIAGLNISMNSNFISHFTVHQSKYTGLCVNSFNQCQIGEIHCCHVIEPHRCNLLIRNEVFNLSSFQNKPKELFYCDVVGLEREMMFAVINLIG